MTEEEWFPIPSTDGSYEITKSGKIRRSASGMGARVGRLIRPRVEHRGYVLVTLCIRGGRRQPGLHRLLMETFVGPCPDGHEVNHIDGNPSNNDLGNLEYVTKSENMLHAAELKGSHRGEKNATSKLTEAQVGQIREARASGVSPRKIAADFGVSYWTVWEICTNRTWAYGANRSIAKPRRNKLNKEAAKVIRFMLSRHPRPGLHNLLARLHGVASPTIRHVKRGKIHR